MERDELRALQKPLKDRYRDDAGAARLTLRADGELGAEGVSCSVETGRALVEAGLHPASGGDGDLACSGDMLLQALVACAGVTLRSVAVNRGLEVSGALAAPRATSTSAARWASTRRRPSASPRSGSASSWTSTASEEELEALLEPTERYCVVFQTLSGGVPLEVSR